MDTLPPPPGEEIIPAKEVESSNTDLDELTKQAQATDLGAHHAGTTIDAKIYKTCKGASSPNCL